MFQKKKEQGHRSAMEGDAGLGCPGLHDAGPLIEFVHNLYITHVEPLSTLWIA